MTEEATDEREWYYRFGNCVAAALDTCAAQRWVAGGGVCENGELIDPVVRTADIVATASARMRASDLGAAHELLASQLLALDEIFNQFAGMAAKDPEFFQTSMATALKAQSQCRWTVKALLAMNSARPAGTGRSTRREPPAPAAAEGPQNFCEQTIENGKITA